ncbi:MAG: 50S ribosomal protein L22 [Deltaproteobacteria bacterium]|nr:50S ribosomal protein L22 [Deltaproteobacteria bacterium]
MSLKVHARYVRISPRKMRAVCNLVRGKKVDVVVDELLHSRRRAARSLLKLVRSAVANAKQKGNVGLEGFYVKELTCGDGPRMKRWLPRAKGSASPILKRMCHINLVLDERA